MPTVCVSFYEVYFICGSVFIMKQIREIDRERKRVIKSTYKNAEVHTNDYSTS